MAVQRGWRWCKKCEVLFYAPLGSTCPAGGGHDASTSACYLPYTDGQGGTQDKWRWCKRCGAMFFSGNGAGRCVGGVGHDASGSGQYFLATNTPPKPSQVGWRWCRNCQSLFWGGGGGGVCPNGGKHDGNGSSNYGLRYQVVGGGVVLAYQGKGDDGTIWLSVRQNGSWEKNIRVPGGCSETPSPVMYNGKLYIFYQGMGNSRTLWYTTFDGAEFSASIEVPDVRLKGAPAAFVVDNRIEVWIQGTSQDVDLWRVWPTDLAKNQWASALCDPRASIWNDPGCLALPAAKGGGAWIFYEKAMRNMGGPGATAETHIYSTRHKKHFKLGTNKARATPKAVWHEGYIFLFREADTGNGEFVYARLSPEDDGAGVVISRHLNPTPSGVRCTGGVAPVSENRGLWVFYEAPGATGELYCIDAPALAENWNIPPKRIDGVGVSGGCGATLFHFNP